jgi:sulfide:quinone oxidoreductase
VAWPLNVLIAGGGVAALEATLGLRELAAERVSVELLAPEPEFWYRPLSVVEPFGIGNVHGLDLADLVHACGASFTLGALASVDPEAHVAVTTTGAELEYDVLLVASGARPEVAIPGALTFRGPADVPLLQELLAQLGDGLIRDLVFAAHGGTSWPLPLYELALMTASFIEAHDVDEVAVSLVTSEDEPLAIFGPTASAAVRELLDTRGISVHSRRYPVAVEDGELALAPVGAIPADRVVALPRLRGNPISGLPRDRDGFIPTNADGRVAGYGDVYAAGDVTTFPVKQGGIAAQQAAAAAETIAAAAGAPVRPEPFRPVLRGLLLTGATPAYLRAELVGGGAAPSLADTQPLWWPPGKIVGRRLAPFLSAFAGAVLTPPEWESALVVEADLTDA